MQRALVILNVLLLAGFGVLWSIDSAFDTRDEARRSAESAFHAILDGETPTVAGIVRVDLKISAAAASVQFERRGDAWRLPQYRDGYALAQELDGILKALLESRGTVAGRLPVDAEYFGFAHDRRLTVDMYDIAGQASGQRQLRAIVGRVAPGQRSDECYVVADGRDRILHLGANPWSFVPRDGDPRFPPLLDVRVIPSALRRGLPAKISFAGDGAPALREVFRREAPKDPREPAKPDQGPRYEWFGLNGDAEIRINDSAAFAYCQMLASISFDELVGPSAGQEKIVERATLVVTIEYDGGTKDTIHVAAIAAPSGHARVSYSGTELVCLLAQEKSRALVPNQQALLEPPRTAPQSRPK